MEDIKCKKCGKGVDKWAVFSGGICLECHKEEYDKLSEEDKKPRFDGSLLN